MPQFNAFLHLKSGLEVENSKVCSDVVDYPSHVTCKRRFEITPHTTNAIRELKLSKSVSVM